MSIFRVVIFLSSFVLLFSCAEELSPDQRAILAQNDKLPLYFSGNDNVPTKKVEQIGAVTGYSCKTAWLQSSASEEEALKNLWQSAAGMNATAAINVSCEPIKFFTPQVQCWPGIYCKGDAVK